MPQKTVRRKHVPQRTCVGCRSVMSKRSMVRIVRRPEGLQIDRSGKLAGRGAYLHNQRSCWEKGLKGSLAQALKTTLTEQDRQRLLAYMADLPDDAETPSSDQGNQRQRTVDGAC